MAEIAIRPLHSCVPGDLAGQASFFANWNAQMQIIGASLGYATGELDRIKDDNTYVQFLSGGAVSVDAYRGAMTDFRRGILTARNGSTTPDYPSAFAGLVLPATGSPVTAGIWDRLNGDIERVRAYPTFTTEAGSLLGINPIEPTAPDLSTFKPGLQVFPAAYGMEASIVVSGREKSDQWQVLVARVGTADWSVLEVGTGKSVNVHFTPGEGENGPVQLQFRIQLRLANANYAQPSDIVLATLNP